MQTFKVKVFTLNRVVRHHIDSPQSLKNISELRIKLSSFSKFKLECDFKNDQVCIYCCGISKDDFSIQFKLSDSQFYNLHSPKFGKGRLPQVYFDDESEFAIFPENETALSEKVVFDLGLKKIYKEYVYEIQYGQNKMRIDSMNNLPFWIEF